MARRPFGGGGDAVVLSVADGNPMPNAGGTAWDARAGGTQILDVADDSGTTLPSSQVVTDVNGAIAPFLGPADSTPELWMDFGAPAGGRFRLTTSDLPGRVETLEGIGGIGGVPADREIATSSPLTGGGDLSGNLEIGVTTGTTAGTLATGDDSRIVNALPKTLADAKGDLLAATADDTVARLTVGADGTVLTADSAASTGLSWQTPSGGGSGIPSTLIDAKGDLIAGSAADTAARLAVGADGQMLYVDSTQTVGVKWAAPPSGTGISPSTVNAKGDLIAGTADDTVARLGVGFNGQILTADSAQTTGLTWTTPTTPIAVSLLDAKGDLVVAFAADTAAKLSVGSNGQVLTADSTATNGVKWATASGGSSLGLPNALYVVANDASGADKARADYQCDGIGDQVEILTAIAAAKTAGHGAVSLSEGTFAIAAPITLDGADDVDVEVFLTLLGAGTSRTVLACGSITAGVQLRKCVQVHTGQYRIEVAGSTHGLQSVATNTSGAGYRSFWLSHIHDIEVVGDFASHSGWAFHLESPFRSRFANLEANGVGNGLRMFSGNDAFNPGDLTVDRAFMDIVGNNHVAYSFESTAANGNLNQLTVRMAEAVTSGTGCTGIYIGGSGGTPGPVNHILWDGGNLEQFDKLVNIDRGQGSKFHLNYVECRGASSLTAFTFGANAFDNTIDHVGMWYSANTHTLVNDGNTTNAAAPNKVQDIHILADTGATITATRNSTNTTIVRDITAEGAGTVTAVRRSPNAEAPNAVITLTDATTIATDASLGNHFRVTLGGNRTLGNPTGMVDGQKIMYELIQDATGGRTITLGSNFALGTDITAVTLTTTASKRDFLGAIYNATAGKLHVVALTKGY